ncbi:MAG: hypothetical protein J7484_05795 [Microbacterium sp.]|nr:hypothetical protein [Microbacterium sp.]
MADEPQRQHVERVRGSRRARLTPVAGTDTAPETRSAEEERTTPPAEGRGPNDERMLRDVPPHY